MPRRSDAIDDAMIERELRARRLNLAFPKPLERFFELETGAERSRRMFWQGVAALVLFLLFLITDYQLTPDVFPLAVVARAGVVAPLILVTLGMLWMNPPPVWREGVVGGVAVLGGLSTLFIMLVSQSPLRDAQGAGVILVTMFLTMLQRLRFPYAVACGLVMLTSYVVAMLSMPGYPAGRATHSILVFVAATVLALIASWSLERVLRRGYLLRLKIRREFSALTDVSLRDPLTGVGNRRGLEQALRALDLDNPEDDLSIVLLDIDHFKSYNDGMGHLAGDRALRQVADLLRNSVRRDTDQIFRFGGEEFLLLLRKSDLTDAVTLAERLRKKIEAENIHHAKDPRQVLTASFGVASTKLGSEVSFDELIAGADTALYAAKRSGRNQVWPPILAARAEQVLRMRARSAS